MINNNLWVLEMILSSVISGILLVIISTQPLNILGPPYVSLTVTICLHWLMRNITFDLLYPSDRVELTDKWGFIVS